MRVQIVAIVAICTSVAVAGLETLAMPQTKPKSPSAEAFSSCREQEKVGDARACWVIWLQKFTSTGSEAEVAYAQEHATAPQAPPSSSAGAAPSATPKPAAPPPVVVPAASVPTSTGMPPSAETEVAHTGEGGPSKAPMAGYRAGDVLDLCALEPKKDATQFQKQRVVLFAPAEAGQVNDDPKIRAQDGAKLVRDIFTARFPLPRFNNVVTELPAKKEWASQETLSVETIQAYVKQPSNEGDKDRTERLDKEREFVGYSVGCTDYVVAPVITSHEAKWEDQKSKTKTGTTTKTLKLKLGGTLAIFKRDGDGFKRIAAIEASVPSLADTLSDTAAASIPPMKVGGVDLIGAAMKIPDLPKYVSAVPAPQCLVGKIGKKGGVGGLLDCVQGEGTVEQAFGGIDERLGPVCRKVQSATGSEHDNLMVQCEVRARAFQLSRAFQKEARSVEGWKLFGVLAKKGDDPAFALGKDEGVKVGYGFQVIDPSGERLAFLKVTDVGAGGESGETQPTVLNLRSGDAPEGARLEEYPQLGLVITPFASGGLVALNSPPTVVSGGAGSPSVQFNLPSFVYGGGANFGWDLSSVLGWTETFARVDGGVLFGTGSGTQVLLAPIDVWFEKGFYMGKTLTFLMAFGPTVQITKLTVVPPAGFPTIPSNLDLSATQFGAAARLGFDFFLGPEWGLRTELFGRVPFTTATYSEANGQAAQAFDQRNDRYATFGLNLGITKGF